jgi:tRNA 2-thiouridine synthesizing protein A
MIDVDARGFSCPVPVVKTKKAIEENPNQALVVLVDTVTSKENVSRLAQSKGYSVKVERFEEGFRLLLNPSSK